MREILDFKSYAIEGIICIIMTLSVLNRIHKAYSGALDSVDDRDSK